MNPIGADDMTSKTIHLKMAKASEEDLKEAVDLLHALEDIRGGREPGHHECDEPGPDLDLDCVESMRRTIEYLRSVEHGPLFRVVWGMAILLDPQNAVVDPDLPHLEVHPLRPFQGTMPGLTEEEQAQEAMDRG